MKKKLDSRIQNLIKNCQQEEKRSIFVIVGDNSQKQVQVLHYLIMKEQLKRPSVLWCYQKELDFSSNLKKRKAQLKKEIKLGKRTEDEDDPFQMFLTNTEIRYCYYKESESILGNTYGMLVLQDFESITPNVLARCVETVKGNSQSHKGGGSVLILLSTMKSLKQLYTLKMDVHERYRVEGGGDIVPRFNERFILSLGNCETCLFMDEELNVLPISFGKDVTPAQPPAPSTELDSLKQTMKEVLPIGSLIKECKTIDQANALLTLVDSLNEKTIKTTCSVIAARGRGKSATLGLAIASAVGSGYANIFITSPSPENLKTLFEFILKGLEILGYQLHLDYDIVQGKTKAITRINLFRDHRQTIQYIQPSDYLMLSQAELVVIDEAAAIPLPLVKNLLGEYVVFMASTVNGYEGTGRSLSLKLLKQLRDEQTSTRKLREVNLDYPIRYTPNDPVEKWLNGVLCLDTSTHRMQGGTPHPSSCELYSVNRDALFSYHPVSESFLQRMMNLYVASHYKNSPNDLLLMSDAPQHGLFVLLGKSVDGILPNPIVVIQVCREGNVSRKSTMDALARGIRQSGDMIPWTISQQYQDDDFGRLSGIRIVRIATHPDYIGMGYGKRAIELLQEYYEGKYGISKVDKVAREVVEEGDLLTEEIKVRDVAQLPPLLSKLPETPLESSMDWIGVSYGLTPELFKFWKRSGMKPVYIRQTTNDLTGEHTCMMIRQYQSQVTTKPWLDLFVLDFRKRFVQLLAYNFKSLPISLVLSILATSNPTPVQLGAKEVERMFSLYDLKRLESYSSNLLDYHVIMDLIPSLAQLVINGDVEMRVTQSGIVIGIGCQKKSVEDIASEMGLGVSQVLAVFAKSVKKISQMLNGIVEGEVKIEIEEMVTGRGSGTKDVEDEGEWKPTEVSLEEDLSKSGNEVIEALKAKQREMVDSLDLKSYVVGGEDEDWEKVAGSLKDGKIVQVKNSKSSKKRKGIENSGVADGLIAKGMDKGGKKKHMKKK